MKVSSGTSDFNWPIIGAFTDEFDASSVGSGTVEIFEEDAAVVEFGENNIAVTSFGVGNKDDAVSCEELGSMLSPSIMIAKAFGSTQSVSIFCSAWFSRSSKESA